MYVIVNHINLYGIYLVLYAHIYIRNMVLFSSDHKNMNVIGLVHM